MANLTGPALIYPHVKKMNPSLTAPQVDVTCIVGDGMPTERRYVYPSPNHILDQTYPNTTCWNGDGTIVEESLAVCEFWGKQNLNGGKPLEYRRYLSRDHVGILMDTEVIHDVLTILQKL